MKSSIWNFWANKYDRLWVQKYSLTPTRNCIVNAVSESHDSNDSIKVLDLGCGPGELIKDLTDKFASLDITGIDFSEKMLEISMSRNPHARHIKIDASDLYELKDKFDVIICTHSLPYYKEPKKVMKELSRLLNDDGRLFMGFASGNDFYDKFILGFVKLTTGPAYYPSHEDFKQLTRNYFQIEDLKIIREKLYMPRIAIYTLKKAMS